MSIWDTRLVWKAYMLHKIKKKATVDAPEAINIQQLCSFLGLVHAIPNLASLLAPMNCLLKENTKWEWLFDCQEAMLLVNQKLISADVLAHYDPQLPIKRISCYPDKSERPIAFASRTLTSAERNSAQIEKEALSLVFGVHMV